MNIPGYSLFCVESCAFLQLFITLPFFTFACAKILLMKNLKKNILNGRKSRNMIKPKLK